MVTVSQTRVERPLSWRDEDLVAVWQREHNGLALAELEARYRGARRTLVTRLVRTQRLAGPNCQDASQDTAVAFLQAVNAFRPAADGATSGRPFRDFLLERLQFRLQDGCRWRRRAERALDRSRPATEVADTARTGAGAHAADRGRSDESPLTSAATHEAQAPIAQATQELPTDERRLAEGLKRGEPLTATARCLGISYEAARTLKWRVQQSLAVRLRGLAGD